MLRSQGFILFFALHARKLQRTQYNVLSTSRIALNSSMQHSPLSASTKAPASSIQSPLSCMQKQSQHHISIPQQQCTQAELRKQALRIQSRIHAALNEALRVQSPIHAALNEADYQRLQDCGTQALPQL